VAAIEAGTVGLRVLAHGAFTRLGQTEVEGSYENVSADFIIKDLIGKAGATAGTLAKGPTLAFWTLHGAPPPSATCAASPPCAERACLPTARAPSTAPRPARGTEHRFAFGETVIELAIRQCPPAFDSVEVWGEGAASAKGADRAHWLSTELSVSAPRPASRRTGKCSRESWANAPCACGWRPALGRSRRGRGQGLGKRSGRTPAEGQHGGVCHAGHTAR
jgi:hypothetical protein